MKHAASLLALALVLVLTPVFAAAAPTVGPPVATQQAVVMENAQVKAVESVVAFAVGAQWKVLDVRIGPGLPPCPWENTCVTPTKIRAVVVLTGSSGAMPR